MKIPHLRILKYLTSLCICFFNHSNFKTVYNFLTFVYESLTQDLKFLQSSILVTDSLIYIRLVFIKKIYKTPG